MGRIYQERELAPLGSLHSDFQMTKNMKEKFYDNENFRKCTEMLRDSRNAKKSMKSFWQYFQKN